MRACLAVTLLVLVQPSPASCATCTSTSVAPRVLALAHRRLRKSPSVRQPFAEISGSISFSPPVFPFPETVPNFVCHFKGSLHSGLNPCCETVFDGHTCGTPPQGWLLWQSNCDLTCPVRGSPIKIRVSEPCSWCFALSTRARAQPRSWSQRAPRPGEGE